MKTLVVEGWRFIPHSYAMVSQCQCLELLKRKDVALYHRDIPYGFEAWSSASGIFRADQEARLRAIPGPPDGLRPDAVLRMTWPLRLHADPSGAPTFTWGTSETRVVEDVAIASGRPAAQALPASEADIITCSRWAEQGFLNSGAPPNRVSVVPCGADPDTFRPLRAPDRTALRRKLGWEGSFVLLNVSAMTPNKGIRDLLRAAASLLPRLPNLRVILKGSDALYTSQHLVRRAFQMVTPQEASLISPRVGYTGQTLSTEQLVRFYQAADAYVSPYQAEGFNLPVLEAAACGLPAICTRGGSTDDFADDSFALRIDSTLSDCPPGPPAKTLTPSVEHLVELIARVAADGALRARAHKAGPEWVRSRFTWKHSVDALMEKIFPAGTP